MERPPLNRFISLKSGLIIGLALLLVVVGLIDRWWERHKEQRYDPSIVRLAQKHGIEPALVKAVVWRESKFNPKVRGRVGEIGLMQIGALAAKEWAQAETGRPSFEGNLFDPETNLQVGTWYLGKLVKRYRKTDKPVAYALADYNAGRNNVLRWIKGAAETNSNIFITQITFPSTREYVRSIIRRTDTYRSQFKEIPAQRQSAVGLRVRGTRAQLTVSEGSSKCSAGRGS